MKVENKTKRRITIIYEIEAPETLSNEEIAEKIGRISWSTWDVCDELLLNKAAKCNEITDRPIAKCENI